MLKIDLENNHFLKPAGYEMKIGLVLQYILLLLKAAEVAVLQC